MSGGAGNLVDRTFRMHPGDVLVGDGDRIAALTDGMAVVSGVQRRRSTVGLYQIRDGRVAGCWLLPLDPAAALGRRTGSIDPASPACFRSNVGSTKGLRQ
jgi:hypothetical protein